MRIDGHQGAQPLPENQATGGASSASAGASAGTSNVGSARSNAASGASALGEDQTQLSGAHAQVLALVAQALQLPETTQAKVQALRQAVVSGKYKPSPDQVARALLSTLVKAAA